MLRYNSIIGENKMKIASVVGKKNTGKTSLTVKIIEELTRRGYNVASIKHSHHTMEMDRENTDTWKHKEAGSKIVVGIGSTTFFNIRETLDLDRLLYLIKHVGNMDFVIIEGFKRYNYPKIATSSDVVDDYTIKLVDSFSITPQEVSELADLIEEKGHDIVDTLFKRNCGFNNGEAIAEQIRKGNLKTEELDKVDSYLSIDDNVVGLNRFVSDYIKQTLLGIINTLNIEDYGVENIDKLELVINTEDYEKAKTKDNAIIEINDEILEINKFVSEILSNTIKGMVSSLKAESGDIEIEINNIVSQDLKAADIKLKINAKTVEINEFVSGILKESIYGSIKTLKIDEEINKILIKIKE